MPTKKTEMKQVIQSALCLVLFFAVTQLSAQVKVNPKVGVNVSALDTKLGDITTEARAGWNAGLDLQMGSGLFTFNPGIHYYSFTARQFQDIDTGTDIEFKDETTIQSIRVPLNIGLNLTGTGGLLGIRAQGGIVPAYVMNIKERPNFDMDIEDLNRFTMGANVGVALDILFFTVEANYEIGLSDFFKDVEGKNNILTLGVGVKF